MMCCSGMTQIETESSGVAQLKERLKIALQTIKEKGDLIRDVKIASENFFMVLQKYKIDSVSITHKHTKNKLDNVHGKNYHYI